MTIHVIEVPDSAESEMVRRVPSTGSGEFKFGAQVIARESRTAVFFRDGQSLDTFGAGRHTLSTINMPLVTKKITDRVFGQSPFKAEVYLVNKKVSDRLPRPGAVGRAIACTKVSTLRPGSAPPTRPVSRSVALTSASSLSRTTGA
jgi:hypothetical protein